MLGTQDSKQRGGAVQMILEMQKEGNRYSCVSVAHNACWYVNSAPPAQTEATAGTAGDVMMEWGVEFFFF